MNTFGIDRYSTNELTATVLINYDPKQIQKHQLVEILDATLSQVERAIRSPRSISTCPSAPHRSRSPLTQPVSRSCARAAERERCSSTR